MRHLLAWDATLAQASRFPLSRQSARLLSVAEVLWLVGMGLLAGLITASFDFSLRIPGHAILRGVVPIALGLSLVPRRHAGSLMGIGTVLGLVCASRLGASFPGTGSATSVTILGPVLDQLLQRVDQDGKWLYPAFALAGLLSNYVALAVRATQRAILDGPHGTAFFTWLLYALLTYALCGILAGTISATLGFRFRRHSLQGRSS